MRPLASPDEGRYSEIPREMVAHGDYVTPRLNDMPYFYKPPFFYWMQAASIKTFGINRFSLRFPNALMAVFGICATYAAARALSGRAAGVFSAGILATSILYLALGQIITLDTTVSVFISSALFAFIVGIKKSTAFPIEQCYQSFQFVPFCGRRFRFGIITVPIHCSCRFVICFHSPVPGRADSQCIHMIEGTPFL